MLKHINNDKFKDEVLENKRLVLVDFFATWCPPCKMLSPILEKISTSRVDFDIVKINIDEEQSLAYEYRIESVPTMLVFKNGKVVDKIVGYSDEDKILTVMNSHMEEE